jgi:hypothetical protein
MTEASTSSTRGRAPRYDAILLEPTCKTWFQQPTRDPRRPENTIGKGHQHKYKESCLQRILEQSFSTDAIHALSLEDMKTALDAYLKRTMTDEEYTELLANYYTPDYLQAYHQQFIRTIANIAPTPVSTSAPLPRFDAIKAVLKKKKAYKNVSFFNLNDFIANAIVQPIREKFQNTLDSASKVNELMLIFILEYIIHLMLILEQRNHLKPRFVANVFTQFAIEQRTFKAKPKYLMYKFKHYMATFLQLVDVYLSYKKDTGKLYVPLTGDEWLDVLRAIKLKYVSIFGLQAVANEDTMIESLVARIRDIPTREVYQYLWFLFTEKMAYPKPTAHVKEANLEINCIDLFSSIQDGDNATRKAFKQSMIERCSMLKKTDCEETTQQRRKLLTKLNKKYMINTPANSEYLENYMKIDVRRPHALIDFFKQWVAQTSAATQEKASFWKNYFDVSFKGEEGYFVGVQTDLFQTCMDALHPSKMNLFIPTEDGSSRYIIHRDFDFNKDQRNELEGFIDFNGDYKGLFLEFVGGLLARCVLESIDAPVKLSYFTMAYLYTHGHFEAPDYGFYFIMDMPGKAKSFFNLLTYDASIIESLDMSYNDLYPLMPTTVSGEIVSGENILDYIQKTGKYALISAQPTDPAVIPIADAAIYEEKTKQYLHLLRAFSNGFFINVSNISPNEESAIHLLDDLISRGGVNPEHLNQWVQRLVVPNFYEPNGTPRRIQEIAFQQQIFKWMKEDLLGNPLIPLPYADILPDASQPPKTDAEKTYFYYHHFIPQLLYFWTGSRSINMQYKHTIQFILNDPMDVPATQYAKKYELLNAHPVAHTCSKTMDVPTYLIDLQKQKKNPAESIEQLFQRINEDRMMATYLNAHNDRWKTILLKRLCTAMYQSQGFGMAGGGVRRRKYKK